jgi:hypothetical protein
MSETAQQYTQRILSNAAGTRPNQGPIRHQQETDSPDQRRLSRKTPQAPAPDKWSVAEILAHLADVEIVIGWRMRSILGDPGTAVQAYDQNSWVIRGHYEKRDPRKSIEIQRVVREANLALLKTLSPAQWKTLRTARRARTGIHRTHCPHGSRTRSQPYPTNRANRKTHEITGEHECPSKEFSNA